jgi:hypothetical protein
MGALKWYKRDPRAALIGMMELSLAERGAYTTVLDLIYVYDGALPDSPEMITGYLRVSPVAWGRIRTRLISAGKLYVHGGCLRNERADFEVEKALKRISSAAKAGLASADQRTQPFDSTGRGTNGRSTTVQRPLVGHVDTPTPTPTKNLLSYSAGRKFRGDDR